MVSHDGNPHPITEAHPDSREGTLFETSASVGDTDEPAQAEAGVSLTLDEYYRSQLALLAIVGQLKRQEGFNRVAEKSSDIAGRYGRQLPSVVENARQRAYRLASVDLPKEYREVELIEAGFEPHDVTDDITAMRYRMKKELGGPENKSKRKKRKDWLEARVGQTARDT